MLVKTLRDSDFEVKPGPSKSAFLKNVYLFILRERVSIQQREGERGREGERERQRERESQAGSVLSVQSPILGPNL